MQSLTELRSTLMYLHEQASSLHGQINACLQFLDTLTGRAPTPLPTLDTPRSSKANGSAGKAISPEVFKAQVRTLYHQRRKPAKTHPKHAQSLDAALDAARKKHRGVADPSPDTLTTQEVSKRLRLSDAGVRKLVGRGQLPEPRLELRRFGAMHSFRPTAVHKIPDIEAYAVSQMGRPPRRRGRPAKTVTPARAAKPMDKITRQRAETMTYLALYDQHQPRTIPGSNHGLGPLVRRGYLRKKRGGYVRTAKEFSLKLKKTPKPKHAMNMGNAAVHTPTRAPRTKAGERAKRQITVGLLALYDADEVRPATLAGNPKTLGPLVQHGYLRPLNGGYVRTGKEFHP